MTVMLKDGTEVKKGDIAFTAEEIGQITSDC